MNHIVTETAANMRGVARSALKGNWKHIVLGIILYMIITSLVVDVLTVVFPNYIKLPELDMSMNVPMIPYIYLLIIGGPMELGLVSFIMYFFRKREVNEGYIFNGFGNFLKAFGMKFMTIFLSSWPMIILYAILMTTIITGVSDSLMSIVMLLCVMGMIPAGIYMVIKTFAYSQSYFVLTSDLMDENKVEKKKVMECIRESNQLMKGNKGGYFMFSLSYIGWALVSAIPYIIVEACFVNSDDITLLYVIATFIAQLPMAIYYAYMYTGMQVYFDILIGRLRPMIEESNI